MTKKKKNYIDSNELKEEILKCKESKIPNEKLGKMFIIMVDHVSKSFFWENPDDGEDCKANALLDCCSNFWKFNPEHGNAFAFMSQIIYFGICGAFRQLNPKKYNGTISLTCLDDNGNNFEIYNI